MDVFIGNLNSRLHFRRTLSHWDAGGACRLNAAHISTTWPFYLRLGAFDLVSGYNQDALLLLSLLGLQQALARALVSLREERGRMQCACLRLRSLGVSWSRWRIVNILWLFLVLLIRHWQKCHSLSYLVLWDRDLSRLNCIHLVASVWIEN